MLLFLEQNQIHFTFKMRQKSILCLLTNETLTWMGIKVNTLHGVGGRTSGNKMKRGRTAVKGNGTVGLTEGRKEGRKGEKKDYQLSVQSPAGFVIGGQKRKRKKLTRRKDGPVSAASQSTPMHPLISRSPRVHNKSCSTETGEMLPQS